jgi:branched-chain amino acid transport system ATP-binding protein
MAEPLLSVRELQSGYGDVTVLWSIDLDVSEGEIASIVGSNGAGKTTLLRTISGVVRASAGAITFAGRDVVRFEPDVILGTGIAHVPEGRRLFRGLSVRDNLLLGAHLRRDRAEIARDLDFVFGVFPVLRERKLQDATTLSGGEQQMCAIGRGLMARPRLLMLDEPSLGLAPVLVKTIFEDLARINGQGLTVLVVEQNVLRSLNLAHRGYVLENGRMTLSGPRAELLASGHIKQAYLGL